ncbi:hypothetical protein BDA99DRAFT_530652 [Phascolomyces articulosus]|uniref:Uncharacterized protein n=1 Tax=Phascolomyces articulosus TaxID=60185 RepID=A0AAD5P6V2_9FUNG|nr:hypothetical protein BDA99DRAFT_530652 [Phascolomyces articulosus]
MLWHVLIVTPAPPNIFTKIRTICRDYLVSGYPSISFDRLCLPRSKGRLGILDPSTQQLALQSYWIHGLFGSGPPTFIYPYLLFIITQHAFSPSLFHSFFTNTPYTQFPISV